MKKEINKNKWNRRIAGVMLFVIMCALVPVVPAHAASATITLTTESEEIRVGDTIELQMTISADAVIGDFEAFLTYDDTVLEFYSAASCITGGAGMLKVADIGASPSKQDRTYRIYFKALQKGECEIAMYGRPVIYSYTDGTEMSVTGVSKLLTVLPADDASSDGTLAALHLVDNKTTTIALTPNFSSETTTYYASVKNSAEFLIVSAIASDPEAMVEVVGGGELSIGNNEIQVVVTAENGSQTIYTVYVYRSETEDTEEHPGLPEEPQAVMPSMGMTPEFSEEELYLMIFQKYKACVKPEDMVLPDGYIETTLLIEGQEITAYTKYGEPEEFLLLWLENGAGEANWYRYDRIEQTLQRVYEEQFVITQIIEQKEEGVQEAMQQYEAQQVGLIFAVALLSGICFALLMLILWLCIRHKNRG